MIPIKTSGALLLALALTACGGGGGGSAPASQPLTVAPSLGKVLGGSVQVRDLAGSVIALGGLGSAGSVDLSLPAGNTGFIVELQGGSGVHYFDEALGTSRPLPAGVSLHAVSAGPRSAVTVTALTELVYRRALVLAGGGPLTPAVVAEAEASVRSLLGLADSDDLLAAPEVVDDPLDLPGTGTWAGRQARLLAAWAQLALEQRLPARPDCRSNSSCTPLLDLIDDIASDLADGALDGSVGGMTLPSPEYPTASADFRAALAAADTAFADRVAAVRAAVPDTDALIGLRIAGSHALTCTQTLPAATFNSVAMTVAVAGDGGFTVRGPFGTVPLAAGNSIAYVGESADGVAFARAGIVVPAGAAALLPAAPVADGLSISLNPPLQTFDIEVSQKAEVVLNTTQPSTVMLYNQKWECSGFALPPAPGRSSATLLGLQDRYRSWLPDGLYRCELGGNPTLPAYLQASAGVLTSTTGASTAIEGTVSTGTTGSLNTLSGYMSTDTSGTFSASAGTITANMGGGTGDTGNFFVSGTQLQNTGIVDTNLLPAPGLDLAGLPLAWEWRDYALVHELLFNYGHLHSIDDVAATTAPRALFGLGSAETGAAMRRVVMHRSLVTGKGFFDVIVGASVLAHCQAYVAPPPPPPPPPPEGCWGPFMFC